MNTLGSGGALNVPAVQTWGTKSAKSLSLYAEVFNFYS